MTWDEVAAKVGVRRCTGCIAGDHAHGWMQRSTYTVHWSDRRLTKLGLRRFLMLAAQVKMLPIEKDWQRLYAYNTWAQRAARDLHVRIPARYSDNDRAKARWLITKEETVPPKVKRWARGRTP